MKVKLFIALLLLRFFCHGSDYYLLNVTAYDSAKGTLYLDESGNIWSSYDHEHGEGVLVMDSNGTVNIYDDEIIAFIGK